MAEPTLFRKGDYVKTTPLNREEEPQRGRIWAVRVDNRIVVALKGTSSLTLFDEWEIVLDHESNPHSIGYQGQQR